VLGLFLSCAAWHDAAVEYWLDADPNDVPAIIRSNARLAVAANEVAVLDGDGQEPAFWHEVMGDARAALGGTALQPAAIRLLGLAKGGRDRSATLPYLILSQRLSRRDVPTQMHLMRIAAENEDYRSTFMHLDTILTTEPGAGRQFFRPMATLLADARARSEIARYGRRPWFAAFAAGAVDATANPADLANLLLASGTAPMEAEGSLLPRLLTRLLDAGEHERARNLAIGFGKASRASIERLILDGATADQRFAPLTWRLGASDAVQTGLGPDNSLEVNLRPNVAAPILERVTAIAPGTYVVEQKVEREADGAELLLSWELRCGKGSGPPASHDSEPIDDKGGFSVAKLEVPAGCGLQFWRLTAVADDTQSDVNFRVKLKLNQLRGTSYP